MADFSWRTKAEQWLFLKALGALEALELLVRLGAWPQLLLLLQGQVSGRPRVLEVK